MDKDKDKDKYNLNLEKTALTQSDRNRVRACVFFAVSSRDTLYRHSKHDMYTTFVDNSYALYMTLIRIDFYSKRVER